MPVNSYCVPVTRGLSTGWPAPIGGEDGQGEHQEGFSAEVTPTKVRREERVVLSEGAISMPLGTQ